MLNKTHLVITIFFILVFIPLVNSKIIFIIIALICSLIPDSDIKSSFLGKYKFFRPLQFFVTHRGFFHSLLFMIIGILFFLIIYPIGAFGFFVGYSSHLIADSFTKEGIRFFYPLKTNFSGKINTGSRIENLIFITFGLLDILLLITIFI